MTPVSWIREIREFDGDEPPLPPRAVARYGSHRFQVAGRDDHVAGALGDEVTCVWRDRLWQFDRTTGAPLRAIELSRWCRAVAFREDGAAVLAAGSNPCELAFWDPVLRAITPLCELPSWVEKLDLSGDCAVASTQDLRVFLIDLPGGVVQRRRPALRQLDSVRISGGVLTVRGSTWEDWGQFDRGPSERVIVRWNVKTGRRLTSERHDKPALPQLTLKSFAGERSRSGRPPLTSRALALSPDGEWIALYDRCIDVSTGRTVALPDPGDKALDVGFSAEGHVLRYVDDRLTAWSLPDLAPQTTPKLPRYRLASASAVAPDGTWMAVAEWRDRAQDDEQSTARVTVLPLLAEGKPHTFRVPGDWVRYLKVSPDSRWLLVEGCGSVVLHDTVLRTVMPLRSKHLEDLSSLQISANAEWLALLRSGRPRLSLYRVADGERFEVTTQGIIVDSVAFSPNGQLLAIACADGTIRCRALPSRRPLPPLVGHFGRVTNLAFSPDSQTLVSTSDDGTALRWSLNR